MYTKNPDSTFYGRFEYIEVEVLGPKLNLSPHTESASCHMLVIKYGQVMLHSKSAILPFKISYSKNVIFIEALVHKTLILYEIAVESNKGLNLETIFQVYPFFDTPWMRSWLVCFTGPSKLLYHYSHFCC